MIISSWQNHPSRVVPQVQLTYTLDENFRIMFKEKGYFLERGFDTRELIWTEQSSNNSFLAVRSGSFYKLFRFTDYYFVYGFEQTPPLEELKKIHQGSKKQANLDFSMPKALRLKVPNINTVLITESAVSTEIASYVSKTQKTVMGGEQDSIFIYDKKNKSLFTSGIDMTTISGEAQLLWGNKKEFKQINGRNRSYYFMKQFIVGIYVE